MINSNPKDLCNLSSWYCIVFVNVLVKVKNKWEFHFTLQIIIIIINVIIINRFEHGMYPYVLKNVLCLSNYSMCVHWGQYSNLIDTLFYWEVCRFDFVEKSPLIYKKISIAFGVGLSKPEQPKSWTSMTSSSSLLFLLLLSMMRILLVMKVSWEQILPPAIYKVLARSKRSLINFCKQSKQK